MTKTARSIAALTHTHDTMARLDIMLKAAGVEATDEIWREYNTAWSQRRDDMQRERQQQGEHYITQEAIRDPECKQLRQRVAEELKLAWTTNSDAEEELRELRDALEDTTDTTLEQVGDVISDTVLGCGTASSEWFANQRSRTGVYDLTNKLYGRINNLWQYCA